MTSSGEETVPVVRLLPVPVADPPYDDEVEPSPVVDGSLALAFPADRDPVVPLRLVPPAAAAPEHGVGSDLPDPRRWAGRFVQVVVEVLAGARPVAQVSPFASLGVLYALERATARLATRRGPAPRPVVVSVHVCVPADGVAEACAVIDAGRRRRAVALRLEAAGSQWRCVALQVG